MAETFIPHGQGCEYIVFGPDDNAVRCNEPAVEVVDDGRQDRYICRWHFEGWAHQHMPDPYETGKVRRATPRVQRPPEEPVFPWNDLISMTTANEGGSRAIVVALSSVFDAIQALRQDLAHSLDDAGSYEEGELLHVPFNPAGVAIGYSPLANVCEDRAKNGWRLLYVVPHHQFESIAVFQAAHTGRGGSDAH